MEIKRFLGEVTWISGNILSENSGEHPVVARIKRAILNDQTFKIEIYPNNNEDGGLIKLNSSNGINYSGTFSFNTSNLVDAKMSLIYYSNPSGALLLDQWIQETYTYTTIIQLKIVTEFPE